MGFRNRIVNPNPVVLILKRGKGTSVRTPAILRVMLDPPVEFICLCFNVGSLSIQLELTGWEVRVSSGLFLSLFEGFFVDVCKGQSFDV